MMKNKVWLLLLLVIFTTSVYADLVEVETDINILVDNRTITVETEDKNYEFTCGDNAASPGLKTITFTRDQQCQNSDALLDIASTLSYDINYSRKYYDKYLECYAAEKLCAAQLSKNNTVDTTNYLDKYQDCFEELGTCRADKTSLASARSTADSAKITCEKDLESCEGGKLTWGVIGAALGAAACYFIIGRKNQPAVSTAERQLPKSR